MKMSLWIGAAVLALLVPLIGVPLLLGLAAWSYFNRNGAPPRGPDDFLGEDGEVKDAWERFDFGSAVPVPATGSYRIQYRDGRGLETERDIHIKRLDRAGDQYAISAHCMLRNAHRTFVNDRIRSAIDLETGEVVRNVAEHAMAAYHRTPAGQAEEIFRRENEALSLLLFVARADGSMRKPERLAIARYLKTRVPEIEISEAELEEQIKKLWIPNELSEFRRTLKTVAAGRDRARLEGILECARAVVATQKTIDPAEKMALDLMEQALANSAV